MMRFRALVCSFVVLSAGCAPRASTAAGDRVVGAAPDTLAPDMGAFRVYRGDGRPASVAAIVDQMEITSVMFVGEQHDDTIGHRVEALLLSEGQRRWATRPIVLSLEMFERDVQGVVDEYVGGVISEPNFLAAARPWPEYRTAYRPMLELARTKKLRVVAANAPRRYVNLVSRDGMGALSRLTPEALRSLPPLPLPEPSAAYRARFDSVTSRSVDHDGMPPHAFDGQWLWDLGMGSSVAAALAAEPDALVLHYSGAFHVERRLGTVEALQHYRPGASALVVTVLAVRDPADFDPGKHAGLADFVILTRD